MLESRGDVDGKWHRMCYIWTVYCHFSSGVHVIIDDMHHQCSPTMDEIDREGWCYSGRTVRDGK